MQREFRLPDIGEGLTEAGIVRWLVAEGESVETDQPVVEVETDKAVVEIPSPYAGTVVRHGGDEGDTIDVGEVLVVIEDDSVSASETVGDGDATAAPIVGTLIEEAEDLSAQAAAPDLVSERQVKALPIVRKMARDMGLNLTSIEGSGPGGRITREDVLAVGAASTSVAQPESPPRAAPLAVGSAPSRGVDERRPVSRLRRTIAANMSKSWAEIPHVTTFDDVDATRLLEVRQALGSRYDTKIPLDALVVRAVIPALRSFPEFNATLDGTELIIHGAYDIGIAVDTPEGLLVAVVRDAAAKGIIELASEVRRLGEGAKSRSLKPDELIGQTFTVSNIGAVGGGYGTPIVPPGTTAILSVGRAQQKPIVVNNDLAIAPVMPLSLSYDHRVIDGGLGRRFMAQVMENFEEPALFLAT